MTLSIPKDMRAYRINEPGGPEQLILTQMPLPDCPADNVLIRVRAFGLNRSEWFTRRGDSPNVRFPRVLGIECVGEIVDGGNTDLKIGQRVAAMMEGGGWAGILMVLTQNIPLSHVKIFSLYRLPCRGKCSAPYPRCYRPLTDRYIPHYK